MTLAMLAIDWRLNTYTATFLRLAFCSGNCQVGGMSDVYQQLRDVNEGVRLFDLARLYECLKGADCFCWIPSQKLRTNCAHAVRQVQSDFLTCGLSKVCKAVPAKADRLESFISFDVVVQKVADYLHCGKYSVNIFAFLEAYNYRSTLLQTFRSGWRTFTFTIHWNCEFGNQRSQ